MTEIFYHGNSFDKGVLRVFRPYNEKLCLEKMDCETKSSLLEDLAFLGSSSSGDEQLVINGGRKRCCSDIVVCFNGSDKSKLEDIMHKYKIQRSE